MLAGFQLLLREKQHTVVSHSLRSFDLLVDISTVTLLLRIFYSKAYN